MMSLVWGGRGTWGIDDNRIQHKDAVESVLQRCSAEYKWADALSGMNLLISPLIRQICVPVHRCLWEAELPTPSFYCSHFSILDSSSFFFILIKSTTELTNGTQPVPERRAGASLGTLYAMMPAISLLTPVN